jgi:hypothetical protein
MVLSRDLYPLSVPCPILSDGMILSPQVPLLLLKPPPHSLLVSHQPDRNPFLWCFHGTYFPFLSPAPSCRIVRYYPLKTLSSSSSLHLIPSLSLTSLTEIHFYGVVTGFFYPLSVPCPILSDGMILSPQVPLLLIQPPPHPLLVSHQPDRNPF